MMKFLFICLAIVCTLLGFGFLGLIVWGIAVLLDLFFTLFPMIGIGIACIIFFGYVGWILWFVCKIIWIFASSIYETLCEKYIE